MDYDMHSHRHPAAYINHLYKIKVTWGTMKVDVVKSLITYSIHLSGEVCWYQNSYRFQTKQAYSEDFVLLW